MLLQQNSELKLGIEKIKPFMTGMNLYKKLGTSTKSFDISNALINPPEKCGYSLRTFQLVGNYIEMRKDKKVEVKIKIEDLRKIQINPAAKKAIHAYKSNVSSIPNSENLINKQKKDQVNEYVNFQLVCENLCLDLIAHSYISYISFYEGINEFLKYQKMKAINEFLYHCYN